MKLFTTLCAAAALIGVCGAENLIKNGDFTQKESQWKSPQYFGGKKFHTFDGNTLTVSGNVNSKYNTFAALIQDLPELDPELEYIISADITANVADCTGKFVRINLRQADANDKTIRYSGIDTYLLDKNPRKYHAKFRIAPNSAKFRLYVMSANLSDTDQVIVDNICLTAIGGSGVVKSNAAANMVQNGDFESIQLAPWQSRVGKAKTAPFAIVSENFGNILSINGDPTNQYAKFLTLIQTLPQLQAGKKYQLSFRAKAGLANTAGKVVAIQIRESDMDNVTIVYDGVAGLNLNEAAWKEYKVTFIPRIEADKFELYIRSTNLADGDKVFVDDIALIPVK